jgi:perosamine synthetase
MKKIPYAKALITNNDLKSINEAAKKGWGNRHYYYVKKFENMFSKKFRTKYAIATSSCTGALMISMMALRIKKGDDVILADINWISAAAVAKVLGANCIFVDIDPRTWCIDPDLIEKKITPKTKLIIATHLYGNVCDMNKINYLKKKYNIPIIEDAAEAIGSKFQKKYAGTIGDIGVFSFHGTKTITTGEGGMLITGNKQIYKKALLISNLGRLEKSMKEFKPLILGMKFKMTNLQAALGISQLKRFDQILKRKIEIFKLYKKNLKTKYLEMNITNPGNFNSYWMPTIVFDKKLKLKKKSTLKVLERYNIDARPFFLPLSSLNFFKKSKNLKSYDISSRAINLPSYLTLNKKEILKICKIINNLIKKSGNFKNAE